LNLNVQNGKGSHERLSLLYGRILPCWYVAFWFCIILYRSREREINLYMCLGEGWVGGWLVVQAFTFIRLGGREVTYGNMLVKYSAFVETIL